eukprot:10416205-Ditylum_brightwellii.AAC.1
MSLVAPEILPPSSISCAASSLGLVDCADFAWISAGLRLTSACISIHKDRVWIGMGVVSKISWRRNQGISSSCQVVVKKCVIQEVLSSRIALPTVCTWVQASCGKG